MISDEAHSEALEYLYKKAKAEILRFYDKKTINKIGVMKNGIMYCKNRILESQTLRAVGELENIIDLQSFTGVKLQCSSSRQTQSPSYLHCQPPPLQCSQTQGSRNYL